MSEFKPFADNKGNWTLPTASGQEFTVENGKKVITAYGDITITNDAAGAKAAQELAQMFTNIARAIGQ